MQAQGYRQQTIDSYSDRSSQEELHPVGDRRCHRANGRATIRAQAAGQTTPADRPGPARPQSAPSRSPRHDRPDRPERPGQPPSVAPPGRCREPACAQPVAWQCRQSRRSETDNPAGRRPQWARPAPPAGRSSPPAAKGIELSQRRPSRLRSLDRAAELQGNRGSQRRHGSIQRQGERALAWQYSTLHGLLAFTIHNICYQTFFIPQIWRPRQHMYLNRPPLKPCTPNLAPRGHLSLLGLARLLWPCGRFI